MADVIVNGAFAVYTSLIGGLGNPVPLYIGIGTGAGTAGVTDTGLFVEDYYNTTNGGGTARQRIAGTATQQTTTLPNDTIQVAATLTMQHSIGITNVGLFDANGVSGNLTTAPSGGNLISKSDFAVINLNANDTIEFFLKNKLQ